MSTTTIIPTTAERSAAPRAPRAGRWETLRLAAWQVLYEQRAFWRNRGVAFFCFAMPVMFVVVFGGINRSETVAARGGIDGDLIAVPGVLAYGVIMATFANLAMSTAVLRDSGILKRLRGTPLRGGVFVAGRIGSAVIVAGAVAAVTLTLGAVAYDVPVRLSTLPGLAAALVLGTACFSALGIAVLRIIPNADAALAIATGLVLPLTFASDVWAVFPIPGWLAQLADVFPVRHLAHAVQMPFDPRVHDAGIAGGDLAVLAAWLAVGTLLAVRFWRTESRRS